ncbi:ATP-binding cassette domain-containing protein [Streptomyces sp. NPDC006458]|uniref:ATP-binding cassette domain-containing protein n=1 Tax=Streptomyces sp. NPDC006458 TaxID=3154302 RepID=UPI0033BDEFDE
MTEFSARVGGGVESAAGPVMRLRSDPYAEASARMTTWAMAVQAPRTVGAALRLGWRTDRRAVVLWLVSQTLAAAASAAVLAATGWMLQMLLPDGQAPAVESGVLRAAVPAVVVLSVVVAVRYALNSAAQLAAARLAPKVAREADLQVLEAATAVELLAYEDPGFEDALEAADKGADATRELVMAAQALVAAVATLAGAGVYLAVLHPGLLPLLALAFGPRGWGAVRAARVEHAAAHRMLSDSRLRSVWRSYTADRSSAGEVRAATMAPFLLGRYRAVSLRLEAEDLAAVRQAMRVRWLGDGGAALGLGLTWAVLLWLAVDGVLPAAAAGAAVVGVRACAGALDAWVRAGAQLFRTALYLEDWTGFVRRARALRAVRGPARVADSGPGKIRLAGVGFTYPGTAVPALEGVDLVLRRGEVVALVGENGSGKTTLSKLICGLYLAGEGTVCWDGVDLAEADPARVWRQVGVVPQHFTRWPMSLCDNITLGEQERLAVSQDTGVDPAVVAAAEAAGAAELAHKLPDGWQTLLARSWWGGHDLSGGQWQRIAIARAFYRDPNVLVLDEPTSALDARGEHRVFQQLRRLAAGRTTVFVTHRLANVRLADRIVVLHGGRIVEEGDFDTLITAGGLFAELYKLQQDDPVTPLKE